MTYSVKLIFYTLQGAGANAGCNLWRGHEEDHNTSVCPFCVTDFLGTNGTAGGKYASAEAPAVSIERH